MAPAAVRHPAVGLPDGSWWDRDVVAWPSGEFRPAAGADLADHHGLERVFADPAYVACPAAFHDPVFREPTPGELASPDRRLGERPPVVAAFDGDAGGPGPTPCLVAAQRLEIVREHVLRHAREDAPPVQRFAPWVRRPHRRGDAPRPLLPAPGSDRERHLAVSGSP
ncbi:hypothetical protein [Streptomyces sp. NBC_00199]|uniref:hypothetical protein n=1 Tax=Streptomyces sp. NBC_00199 TaxID=2975678 RepID=UPI002258635A|nr:hypothetical protein [Streptomyces sp. NBC_00199]MCX5268639.1 hypothetical protein [Streptomyces sp. NBC_00199]